MGDLVPCLKGGAGRCDYASGTEFWKGIGLVTEQTLRRAMSATSMGSTVRWLDPRVV